MKRSLLIVSILCTMPVIHAQQPASTGYNWYKIGTYTFGAVTALSAWWALKPAKPFEKMSKETKAKRSDILTDIRSRKEFIKKIMDSKEIESLPTIHLHPRSKEFNSWCETILRWYGRFNSLSQAQCNVLSSHQYRELKQKMHDYYMSNEDTEKEARLHLKNELDKAHDLLFKAHQKKHLEFFGRPRQRSLTRFILPGLAGAATIKCALHAYNF